MCIEDSTPPDKTVTADYALKSVIDEDGRYTFLITNDTLDRANDSVDPDGLDIRRFLENPRVLKIHDDKQWPIGRFVKLERVGNGWRGTVEFCPADYPVVGPDAEFCRRALRDGFINAVSIGFRPLNYTINEAGGMTITESELLEFSIVPIPCNPDCLLVELPTTAGKDSDVIAKADDHGSIREESDIISKDVSRRRVLREIDIKRSRLRLTK